MRQLGMTTLSSVHWLMSLSLMIRWRDTFPIVGRKLPFVVRVGFTTIVFILWGVRM